jgi:glutamate---cysteine ligase / carboxylate-amine ligase
MGLELDQAREAFESSTDFTVGLEEEFALLDPVGLSMVNEFEGLAEEARRDDVLAESVAGELISSEIEIRSGKGADFADAVERQLDRRNRLFALAARRGIALGAMGTHPWSPWREQKIIDTPHYRRVEDDLRYVAWRNNTFSIHVHVGIRGADRAVAVSDAMRPLLPTLLAASANSAFVEGVFSGLHSARTQIFTRAFPRCGIPDHFGDWRTYLDYVTLLQRTNSIVEYTQVWWSVRPHLTFGTVELRIMDAQSRGDESFALAALATACLAQAAIDYDEGIRPEPVSNRLIEENFWRAIRYGLDGKLIDFARGQEQPARAAIERLVDWSAPARQALGLDVHLEALARMLSEGNGAQRQWRRHERGDQARDIYAASVAETCATYPDASIPCCDHLEGVMT